MTDEEIQTKIDEAETEPDLDAAWLEGYRTGIGVVEEIVNNILIPYLEEALIKIKEALRKELT